MPIDIAGVQRFILIADCELAPVRGRDVRNQECAPEERRALMRPGCAQARQLDILEAVNQAIADCLSHSFTGGGHGDRPPVVEQHVMRLDRIGPPGIGAHPMRPRDQQTIEVSAADRFDSDKE